MSYSLKNVRKSHPNHFTVVLAAKSITISLGIFRLFCHCKILVTKALNGFIRFFFMKTNGKLPFSCFYQYLSI